MAGQEDPHPEGSGTVHEEKEATDRSIRWQEGTAGNEPMEESTSARFGGMEGVWEELKEIVCWPNQYRAEMERMNIQWSKGVLLHGPPGTGKTMLVKCLAQELDAKLFHVSSATAFGAYAGESEKRVRELFQSALEEAKSGKMALVFLDELDTLCPKRDSRQQHSSRVTAQLLTLLDNVHRDREIHLPVLAATNRPNEIDPALRRAGRFDREIAVGPPDLPAREAILRIHLRKLPCEKDEHLKEIAKKTSGYTGADLAALCREAALRTLNASGLAQKECRLTLDDFEQALMKIKPSLSRGSALDVGDVEWDHIGGLEPVKRKLRQSIEWPFKHPEAFERLNVNVPSGILLYGPPGCSKTTLARAAAKSSGATFIPLSCADLFSMYLGEGEEWLRVSFTKARLTAPTIIFLDEIDAIGGRRKGGGQGGGGADVGARLLSTLLTEMDGLVSTRGVIVLGATNRPYSIDTALMRPGRLDVLLYVPPPDHPGRLEAFRIHTRKKKLAADVELKRLADLSEGFTGADIEGVCREAAFVALRESIDAAEIAMRHFEQALASTESSVDKSTLQLYEQFHG